MYILYIYYIYTCRLLLFLRRDFYYSQKSWKMDKSISAVTYSGVDFYILNVSVLHARVVSSRVCATEYGLFFLTEAGNLAHMVFSGKHQCLQAKWEQQEVTQHATLRSLAIKVNCMVWIIKEEWNWLITALTLILQRPCHLKMLSFPLTTESFTPDFMRHLVWARRSKIRTWDPIEAAHIKS